MTSELENTHHETHFDALVAALGDTNWRARQVAIEDFTRERSPEAIALLVEILQKGQRNLSRLNAAIQILTRTENDVIPALLQLLTEADAETRVFVALTLGLRGDTRAIPALVATLSDRDSNTRVHAIEALGKLQAAAAVESLIPFIESRDFEFAYPAIDALIAIGDERVAHHLIPLLRDPLLDTAAVEALGALGGEEAVIPLCDLFFNCGISTGTIARAVEQIHDRHVTRYGDGQAIVQIVRQALAANVSTLRSAMPGMSVSENKAIISIIGWLPDKDADSTLLDLLDSPELAGYSRDVLVTRGTGFVPEVLERFERSPQDCQLYLIELCGRIADRRSVPILLRCLDDEDEEIVAKSFDALAKIGDSRAYQSAKSFLGHVNLKIRSAAVSVLNSLGHPDTAGDMKQRLNDPSPLVRESAIKVAAFFGFPDCLDSILACCDSHDERVCRTAIEHLPCLDDNRIAAQLQKGLVSSLSSIRIAAAGALGEVEPQWAGPLIQNALKDSDVWVRYFALRSQARLPFGPDTTEVLESLARGDPGMQVRIAAVEAMGPESLFATIELSRNVDDDLAVAALAALGRTRHPDALPTLILAARSRDRRNAVEAIRALGNTRLDAAIPALEIAALERDSHFAEEAIAALGRIPAEESIDVLLKVMETPAKRRASIAALVNQGDSVVPILARHLPNSNLDVRLAIVRTLIGIRSHGAIELLEFALADAEPAVRYAALSALAHIRNGSRQNYEATGSEGDA